jgi:hypothetical protein
MQLNVLSLRFWDDKLRGLSMRSNFRNENGVAVVVSLKRIAL